MVNIDIIGITGGSGSGKSYISNILKDYGCFVIDADKIGHVVLKKDMYAYKEVVNLFGQDILNKNKEINRKILGQIVFNDKLKLEKLTKITHKYIIKIIKEKISILKLSKDKYKCIIIDAALLIESGLYKICSKVVLVYADKDIRVKRIINRDNIKEADALKRIESQTEFSKAEKYADIILENNALSINDIQNFLNIIINKN